MSSAMTRLFRLPALSRFIPRRSLASNPPAGSSNPVDTVVGLTTFMVCFLVPSGWILANLEDYKKRD